MASSKEVLNEWLKQGKYLDDNSAIDSLYNMKGLTDELAEQRFLERYGSVSPFDRADRITEPTIPSMENVIAILGIADDPKEGENSRTKEQKFIEDFPKKLTEWKKKIEKNTAYGKNGWETVKKIWQQASNQKMLSDIAKARKEAMDDAPLDFYGLGQVPNVPGSSFVTRLLFPRATEHLENTGSFDAKDVLADIAENAAMSVPGGAFSGLGGKVIAKAAPRVASWASKAGSGVPSRILRGAANMGGNIFGNAVVPFASEIMDAALYGDDDEGMEHRADFSLGDALVGTAINQGVNRGLMAIGGAALDRFGNGGMGKGGASAARNALENVGQASNKRGIDFANSVARKLKSPVVNAGELTDDAVIAARTGSSVGNAGITAEEYKKALADQAVIDAIQNGSIKVFDKDIAKGVTDDVRGEVFGELLEKQKKSSKLDMDDVVNLAKVFGKPGYKPSDVFEIPKSVPIDLKRITGNPTLSEDFLRAALDEEQIAETIARNPDAFINYATWYGKGPGIKTATEARASKLKQAAPSWGINKYGSEGDATVLLSMFPETKKAIDENRQEVHEAPKKRKKSAAASDILRGVSIDEELTAQDRKFLSAIENNPDILKFGYKEDPNAFRLWLLEKGNSILQNYPAFRPTFK